MKKTKRFLMLLCLVAIFAIIFTVSASAAGEITDGYYKYRILENDTVEITAYIGNEETVIIPEEFDGKKVTKIGEESFYGVDATKIVLPSGTELIDWFAFCYCENLETVVFNEGLKIIEPMAFANCRAIEEINLPESLEEIGWGVFDDAAERIEELVIPGSLKSCDMNDILESGEPYSQIGVHKLLKEVVFNEGVENIEISNSPCTGLKYVYVPVSVKTLDVGSFFSDRAFESIIYAGSSEQWAGVKLGDKLKKLIDNKEISVHIESEHTTEKMKYVMPSCGSYGYTAGEYCETCDAWISGHEVLISYDKHDYKYIGYLGDGDPAESINKATFEEEGYKIEECIYCADRRETTIPKVASVTLSTTNYVYNGKNRTPKVTVKDSEGNQLVKNVDYKLTISSSRSGIGRYTINVDLIGDYYGYKSVYFYIRPAAPKTIKATRTTTSVKLTWDKADGAAGYVVYRYDNVSDSYKRIKTTTATSYTDKELTAGTKYTYKVIPYGRSKLNNVYYSKQNIIIETATKTKTPSITVSSSSKTKAVVKWNNVSGESGYQVWYSTSKDGTYKRFGNAKANATSLTVTSLTSGKTYYFKVRTYTKTDSGYVYGDYSTAKAIKIK